MCKHSFLMCKGMIWGLMIGAVGGCLVCCYKQNPNLMKRKANRAASAVSDLFEDVPGMFKQG